MDQSYLIEFLIHAFGKKITIIILYQEEHYLIIHLEEGQGKIFYLDPKIL